MKQLLDIVEEALKIKKDTKLDNDKPGVYACFKDLSLSDDVDKIKKRADDVIGVAIIQEINNNKIHRFIISKTNILPSSFGGHKIDLSRSKATLTSVYKDALEDFNGKENSEKIYNLWHGKKDKARITGVPAIEECMKAFDDYGFKGQGYLPALGELKLISDNEKEINKILSLIDGEELENTYYQSSTLSDDKDYVWQMLLSSNKIVSGTRYYWRYVRAALPFNL